MVSGGRPRAVPPALSSQGERKKKAARSGGGARVWHGGGDRAWKVPERARGAPVRPRAGPGAGWGPMRGCGVGARPEALPGPALGSEGMAARFWSRLFQQMRSVSPSLHRVIHVICRRTDRDTDFKQGVGVFSINVLVIKAKWATGITSALNLFLKIAGVGVLCLKCGVL